MGPGLRLRIRYQNDASGESKTIMQMYDCGADGSFRCLWCSTNGGPRDAGDIDCLGGNCMLGYEYAGIALEGKARGEDRS